MIMNNVDYCSHDRIKKLYYMLDNWCGVVYPKNQNNRTKITRSYWVDIHKESEKMILNNCSKSELTTVSSNNKGTFFTGTLEEREITYREIINLCLHEHISFSM